MIKQQTVELTTGTILEANEKRIVIAIRDDVLISQIPSGYRHDHKAGEIVPILSILRITRDGQIIQPPKQ